MTTATPTRAPNRGWLMFFVALAVVNFVASLIVALTPRASGLLVLGLLFMSVLCVGAFFYLRFETKHQDDSKEAALQNVHLSAHGDLTEGGNVRLSWECEARADLDYRIMGYHCSGTLPKSAAEATGQLIVNTEEPKGFFDHNPPSGSLVLYSFHVETEVTLWAELFLTKRSIETRYGSHRAFAVNVPRRKRTYNRLQREAYKINLERQKQTLAELKEKNRPDDERRREELERTLAAAEAGNKIREEYEERRERELAQMEQDAKAQGLPEDEIDEWAKEINGRYDALISSITAKLEQME